MDNLAHTLVGAALGRAVAEPRVPGSALIGAIAGNAPDWVECLLTRQACPPRTGPDYLLYHRGITHSLLGAAVEIIGLSLLCLLVLGWWARRRRQPPPGWRVVAACVAATVLSHLYLDWQGSYGLRPFLPWSDRWFYGDWVAIVDPLFWMLPLAALTLGARRHWLPALACALALAGVNALVLGVFRGTVIWWMQLCVAGLTLVCLVGWVRHWFGVVGRRRAAAYALVALAAYAGGSGLASLWAKAAVRRAALRRFGPDARWAALTVVGRPFRWEPICASADSVAGPTWSTPRHLSHPAVVQALATRDGRALAQFARFLAAEVDSTDGGERVVLRDARYTPRGSQGWATVEVRVR